MRFHKVDLAIHESGDHLKPTEVHADVQKIATRLKATNMMYTAFHVDIQATTDQEYVEIFKSICRLARVLAVPLINIPASVTGTEISTEIKRLTQLVRLSAAQGVILTIETTIGKMTENHLVALELCERVPGLGLTLDPTPFFQGPHATDSFDVLYPHVQHVRLRDSNKEAFQTKIGQGEIEYGKIINSLSRRRYDRALTVDVRDNVETDFPNEPEVRKLKFLLESMV